jgi:hypothetical protein
VERFITISSLILCLGCVEIKTEQPTTAEDAKVKDTADTTPPDDDKVVDEQDTGKTTGTSKFQYTTCDKISASTKDGSQSAESATKFSPGEIITGVLDRSDPDANAHFWKIDVPKGEYIMVLEAEKANNKHGNIMFDVALVDDETKKESRLIRLNEIGYDARTADRFTAAVDRTLILKVNSDHEIGTYKFAFFSPSNPIPLPRFSKCPETRDLKLGKKEVYEFSKEDSNRNLYIVGELEAGEYKVNLKSYTTDNDKSNVGADISQLGEAGDEDEDRRIVNINEISLSESRSGKMLLAKKQTVVIRATTNFSDNGLELEIVKK